MSAETVTLRAQGADLVVRWRPHPLVYWRHTAKGVARGVWITDSEAEDFVRLWEAAGEEEQEQLLADLLPILDR